MGRDKKTQKKGSIHFIMALKYEFGVGWFGTAKNGFFAHAY